MVYQNDRALGPACPMPRQMPHEKFIPIVQRQSAASRDGGNNDNALLSQSHKGANETGAKRSRRTTDQDFLTNGMLRMPGGYDGFGVPEDLLDPRLLQVAAQCDKPEIAA